MLNTALRPIVALLVLSLAFALIAAPLALTPGAPAFAQGGGTLEYNRAITGELTADKPIAIYRLNGTGGDLVLIDALRISGAAQLRLTVLGPDQQTLVTGSGATLVPGGPDAHLAIRLPAEGMVTVLVGSVNEVPGTFMVRARPHTAADPVALPLGVLQQIAATGQPQIFSFEATDCPVTLVGSMRAAALAISVRDAEGQLITFWGGGSAIEQRVTVAPGSGVHTVEVATSGPAASALSLLAACAADIPGQGSASAPATSDGADEADEEEEETGDVIYAADCGPFRLASPREGLPNGPVTVYWDVAPNAAGYSVNVYNEAGEQVIALPVDAARDSATIDVSTAAIGTGFYFTLEVVAYDGLNRPVCTDSAQQGREADAP